MQKLRFKANTAMTLFVVKDKKGVHASLSCKLPDGKMFKINDRSEGFKIDLNQYEGELIDCVLNDVKLVDLNGNLICEYECVFDSNTIADLTLGKDPTKAFIHIGPHILATYSVNELPKDLFKNRKDFKVNIHKDDEYTIVRYANLHQHTEYSLLDGMVKVKDLVKKSEYACAITDHGNMYGYLAFRKAMESMGKKPIIGEEFYVETLNGPRIIPESDKMDMDRVDMFGSTKRQRSDGYNGEHLIVLAKNDGGLQNLIKLSSEAFAHLGGHSSNKPHLTYNDLEKYHDGLIVTSACIAGTLGQSIRYYLMAKHADELVRQMVWRKGERFYNDPSFEKDLKALNAIGSDVSWLNVYIDNHKRAFDFVSYMYDLFHDDFYLEYQDHHFDLEAEIMKELLHFRNQYFPGIKIIAACDAHYLNIEDAYYHEVWLCVQTGNTMSDDNRMKFSGDGYHVHTSDEVTKMFRAEWLDNTLEIADKVEYSPMKSEYHLPHFVLPKGYTSDIQYFKAQCRKGYSRLFKGTEHFNDPVYLNRMKEEIGVIEQMGWPAYFLIVADFIAWARDGRVKDNIEQYFPSSKFNHDEIPEALLKDHEIYIGPGRGSAAGSLVCYCLGITDIDPIKYGLLFER